MPKVLISDALSLAAVQIFKDRGVDVDVKVGLPKDELKSIIGRYDGLAVRSATKVTADVLAVAGGTVLVGASSAQIAAA